jgi:hypothetical protein
MASGIRILLARMADRPRSLVERTLEHANASQRTDNASLMFQVETVAGRGFEILQRVEHADVVLFGLTDGDLPGEASYIERMYPDVKIIGLDDDINVRILRCTAREPLSRDLPSVIRWIARGRDTTALPRSPVR